METALQTAIDKIRDLKSEINHFNQHTVGYNDAYNECIEILESLLPMEKKSHIDFGEKAISNRLMWEPERHGNDAPSLEYQFNETFKPE